jgi:hypothetical protein
MRRLRSFVLPLTVAVLLIAGALALGQFRPVQPYRPPVPYEPFPTLTPWRVQPFRPLPPWELYQPPRPFVPPVTGTGFRPPPVTGWQPHIDVGVRPPPVRIPLSLPLGPHEPEIRSHLQTNPLGVLQLVRKADDFIIPADRWPILVQRSLDGLASQVERGIDPWGTLPGVRQVRQLQDHRLNDEARARLTVLQAQLERQTLRQGVREVDALGPRQWRDAAAQAADWLKRDAAVFQPEQAQAPKERVEARKGFQVVADLARDGAATKRNEHLGHFEALLQASGRDRPAETLQAARRIALAELPDDLAKAARNFTALAEVQQALAEPWKAAPDVARLRTSVAELEPILSGADGDPKGEVLRQQLQQELALKAFLEGHVKEARALLPVGGSPEHAARLLRDMQALLEGKGEVTTEPARRVAPAPPGQGDGARAPPPGLKPLLPEGPADGWRPTVRERAAADLPPLEQAGRRAQSARKSVAERVEKEYEAVARQTAPAFLPLTQLRQKLDKEDEQEQKKLAELKRLLKEPPGEADLIEARHLLREGKESVEVVAALVEGKRRAREHERRSQWIKGYLDRELTQEEETQLYKLLQEDKDSAEVVAVFAEKLDPARRAVPGGLVAAVRLDEVKEALAPLDGFEYARAHDALREGKPVTEVVRLLETQRRAERLKYDLQRVNSYLERPLSAEELAAARKDLEQGKDVAEVVAGFPDALSPERRTVPGGVRDAIRLEEINQALETPLDAFEYADVRQLLRQGHTTADVLAYVARRRAEEWQITVDRRFEEVRQRFANAGYNFDTELRVLTRQLLLQGSSVKDVIAEIRARYGAERL